MNEEKLRSQREREDNRKRDATGQRVLIFREKDLIVFNIYYCEVKRIKSP